MRIEVDVDGNITEHEDAQVIERSKEEIEAELLSLKVQEANQYLAKTDWVESYKIRHDLGLDIIDENSSKWLILTQREEYKMCLKGL
ncbi:MAG: hypothetical protein ACRCXT_09440 [Paraclostridium sp.]